MARRTVPFTPLTEDLHSCTSVALNFEGVNPGKRNGSLINLTLRPDWDPLEKSRVDRFSWFLQTLVV
jgi:hypothetical protein